MVTGSPVLAMQRGAGSAAGSCRAADDHVHQAEPGTSSVLVNDVQDTLRSAPDNDESLNAHYRRAVRGQRTLPDRAGRAQVPLPRHPLAGPTGRGQARWVARCVYDHRDHCARLSPAPATATNPTVTPPTTKPARHRYPSPEAKTAPITWNQTDI